MMTLGDGCVPQCGHDRLMMVLIGVLAFIGIYIIDILYILYIDNIYIYRVSLKKGGFGFQAPFGGF